MTAPAGGAPRRLAALWFADLVGSTKLASRDEDAALAAVAALHEAARVVAERHGGRLVKTLGDGALAEFASAGAAVSAALDLAPALAALAGTGAPPVRVGVHAGEVSGAPGGDVFGDAVNVAARIQAAAEPGAVAVSEDVARPLRGRPGFRFAPLGARSLPGLADPMVLFLAAPAGSAAEEAAPAASIAVLPFANLSSDPENEYFSDGVTEEILTSLARIEELKVISRTSAMAYKGSPKSLREIGRELGVATVLEGSVRRAGGRVRITAQLIDARTDDHLWAERYDRDLADIFEIQSEVAERIVEALKVKLTPGEKAKLAAAPTSLPAYQEYLRGLWFLNRRTPDDLRRAIEHFERSVEADPAYAPAHAGIAGACVLQLHWGREAGAALDPARAVAEARRARSLDPECGEACAAAGMIRIYERDWAAAEHELVCGLDCNPGDATARQWYAHFLACMGRFDEAYEQIERARELDPVSLVVITEHGNVLLLARRWDEALAMYREASGLDPTFMAARYKRLELAVTLQRFAEATDEMIGLRFVDPARGAAIRAAVEAGDRGPFFAALRAVADDSGWPLSFVAWTRLWSGDREGALELLERAVAERDWYLVRLARAPHWDPLRDEPRFQALLERSGLAGVPPPPRETWVEAP